MEFPNAVKSIQDHVVDEWLADLHESEPTCHKPFFLAPQRYGLVRKEPMPSNRRVLLGDIERSLTGCISIYAEQYPGAGACVTWRADQHIVKYPEGSYVGVHNDNAIDEFSKNDELVGSTLSASLVLSDRYTGGEIGFQLQKVEIWLSKGSAVVFPSSFMGTHYVKPIESGSRVVYLEWFGHGKRTGNYSPIAIQKDNL